MSDKFPTFREWWGEDRLSDVTDEELEKAVRGTLVLARYQLAKRRYEADIELERALGPLFSRLARLWYRIKTVLHG